MFVGDKMKKIGIMIGIILFITIGIPFFIIMVFSGIKNDIKKDKDRPYEISVYIKDEDRVVNMEMEQYIKEVTAAEMPAEFHGEALKAQAVAARTYLVNKIKNYNKKESEKSVHKGAVVCTDYSHCKAWISEDKRKELWEEDKRKTYWKKISDAVEDTKNIIMTYDNEPIRAVFHSTSSGWTENAKDVWGGDMPYLVSVESMGDKNSPKYNSKKDISVEEFKKIAQENIENVNWDNGLIGEIKRSDAGGIISIEIGGVLVKGTKFRTIFDLRSTNAEIKIDDEMVYMTVKGYGHGVGMSQYGACYMAENGNGYEEILKTYYKGIELSEFNRE